MLSGILIDGSPSKALLAEPEQTWSKERSRLAFTTLHLVAWSVLIEMVVLFKTQTVFPRNI